ncbi:MAG: radical SAM protein [Chloroflexi bacterium]|nr:radical SAM protein [Chloroflexota bacterium]
MTLCKEESQDACEPFALSRNLWLYTNFDCNLRCSYCVTESTPTSPRLALSLAHVRQLVDQATALGFCDIFFTGGEPFMLKEIYEMLAYSSARVRTTVLTNATLLVGKRLDQLCAVANDNLRVQVSLDGGRPEEHDAYRGQGTWEKTIAGIRQLLARGIHVCISTTETPANSAHLDELRVFRRELGISDQDHFVRPLAKHGFSQDGLDVRRESLEPEVTITAEGVYWHPLSFPGDADMWVREEIFPLADVVTCIEQELGGKDGAGKTPRTEFT